MKNLSRNYTGEVVSEATMRDEDLIESFMQFLRSVAEECRIRTPVSTLQREVDKLKVVEDAYGQHYTDESKEKANSILSEEIWPLMEDIAPGGCWFGSHPGDGACFGFWADVD